MYDKEMIKLVQRELTKETGVSLVVDGIVGPKTLRALLFVPQVNNTWVPKRQIIGYVQYLCATEGIDSGVIDGYLGPQTQYAYEILKERFAGNDWFPWRTDEGDGIGDIIGGFIGNLFGNEVKNDWPLQIESELIKYYGNVGENQTKLDLPYPLRLAWNKSQIVRRITCHEKVAPSLRRILERVQNHYGDKIKPLGLDLWGGTLNIRKIRGGTTWSTHAWGIACDFDPERNQLRWDHTLANFAKDEYNKWNDLWEEEGWVSMGRAKNFDWMHYQCAKVKK